MKSAILLVLLCGSALAQSPVSVSKSNGSFTFTNVSQKPIVLIVGDLGFEDGKYIQPFDHEGIFGAIPFKMGRSESFKDLSGEATLTITFVQFVDGTTWGDPSGASARFALARRRATLTYLQLIATVAESEFTDALDKAQADDDVKKEQSMYKVEVSAMGTAAAWTHAKNKWKVAQERSALWNF